MKKPTLPSTLFLLLFNTPSVTRLELVDKFCKGDSARSLSPKRERVRERLFSRQTFGRILAEAKAIVTDALVMGKIVGIEGGDFDMPSMGRGRHHRGRTDRF